VACLGALLAATIPRRAPSAFWAGTAVALGAAAKFVTIAVAPLFARRAPFVFGLALALVVALAVAPFVPDGGLRELYDRTVGYQLARPSPFSIWGQGESLGWLQTAMKVGTAALAILAALVPRRVDARQLAALGAAVLLAVELTATHWFYLYIVWFVPFVFVAVMAGHATTLAERAAAEPKREPVLA
jgi:hypothetical protein